MCARAVSLILVVVVMVAVVPVRAQDAESMPHYAFVFNTSQGVQIASFLRDKTWRVDSLPRGVFFGQFDVADCVPFWSADGHTLVFMVEPDISNPGDGDSIILSQVGSYDITTQRFQILAEVFDAAASMAEGNYYTGYCIAALSPDARYAWLNSTLLVNSLLVDLQTGALLYSGPYMVTAAAWHTGYTDDDEESIDYVFTAMSGIFEYAGENEQFILTLPDGNRAADLPNAEGLDQQYVNRVFLLDWSNKILFSASGPATGESGVLGLVDVEAGTVDYFDRGRDLQLAEDWPFATYVNTANELVLLDLDSFEFSPLVPAGKYTAWHGVVLVNVTVSGEGDTRDVTMTTYDYSGGGIDEQLVAQGPSPGTILVSPEMNRVLLRFADGTFGLYFQGENIVAQSEVSSEEGTAQLWDYDINHLWGRTCVYMGVQPQPPLESYSVCINPAKGEVVFAPPGYIWAGEGPGGYSVLLAGGVEEMSYEAFSFPELLATSPLTGDTTTIFAQEGEVIYRPAHGSFSDTFIWSPVLD